MNTSGSGQIIFFYVGITPVRHPPPPPRGVSRQRPAGSAKQDTQKVLIFKFYLCTCVASALLPSHQLLLLQLLLGYLKNKSKKRAVVRTFPTHLTTRFTVTLPKERFPHRLPKPSAHRTSTDPSVRASTTSLKRDRSPTTPLQARTENAVTALGAGRTNHREALSPSFQGCVHNNY